MSHPLTFFIRPSVNPHEEVNTETGLRPRYRIADPDTGEYLPDKGAVMPRSGFWLRRVKDGGVEIVESKTPVAQETTGKK